jgi:hypothetical protein
VAAARDALTKSLMAPDRVKGFEEFGRICHSHADYIWDLSGN